MAREQTPAPHCQPGKRGLTRHWYVYGADYSVAVDV